MNFICNCVNRTIKKTCQTLKWISLYERHINVYANVLVNNPFTF